MQRYEYKVVPAPRRGEKARGVKTVEDRFALALTGLMNTLAADGWEYQRADALPVDERAGLTGGTRTSYHNLLTFRRPLAVADRGTAPMLSAVPVGGPVAGPVAAPAPVAAVAAVPAEPVLGTEQEAKAEPAALRLGAAVAPSGPAPSLGPAKSDLAAE